jgi:hypothetical protein
MLIYPTSQRTNMRRKRQEKMGMSEKEVKGENKEGI